MGINTIKKKNLWVILICTQGVEELVHSNDSQYARDGGGMGCMPVYMCVNVCVFMPIRITCIKHSKQVSLPCVYQRDLCLLECDRGRGGEAGESVL